MQKRNIIDSERLAITIERLCHQLIENHGDFSNSVVLGLQPRGIFLAERISQKLSKILKKKISLGYIDATFFRDDFRRHEGGPLKANATKIPFLIEDKEVILVDDVLYTGRTVRAALDAMNAFGRPSKVEFLTLIERSYSRHIPVYADYVGASVNCQESEKVVVELKEQGIAQDNVWLVKKK